MTVIHNLGFPRIGAKRELKFAQEAYWKGETTAAELQDVAKALRARHWQNQAGFDFVPVGDFTLYDHVLDMSVTLGNLPKRAYEGGGDELDAFFRTARGRSPLDKGAGVAAGEMTKWFNSNYHYIVPEFDANTSFKLNPQRLLEQIKEAQALGVKSVKPVIIGPVTYLWLGKSKDDSDRLTLLERLLPVYKQLLNELAQAGAEWVQIDEPCLVTTLDKDWRQAVKTAYHELNRTTPKILLTTYFSDFGDNLNLLHDLPPAKSTSWLTCCRRPKSSPLALSMAATSGKPTSTACSTPSNPSAPASATASGSRLPARSCTCRWTSTRKTASIRKSKTGSPTPCKNWKSCAS